MKIKSYHNSKKAHKVNGWHTPKGYEHSVVIYFTAPDGHVRVAWTYLKRPFKWKFVNYINNAPDDGQPYVVFAHLRDIKEYLFVNAL